MSLSVMKWLVAACLMFAVSGAYTGGEISSQEENAVSSMAFLLAARVNCLEFVVFQN
jgi:hypothetical protein